MFVEIIYNENNLKSSFMFYTKDSPFANTNELFNEYINEVNDENRQLLYDNKYKKIIILEIINNRAENILARLISVQLIVEFIYENKFLKDNIEIQTNYKKMFFINITEKEVNFISYLVSNNVINDKMNVFVEDYNNNYNLNILT